MEYTKGEWILDFTEEHNGVVSVYVPKEGTIARIHTRSCDNYVANAHLIAQAPRLYEASEANLTFLRAVTEQYPELASDYRVQMLISTNEQALTKAGDTI